MREAEFRAWLEAREWNGQKVKTASLRMSRLRRFERAMADIGFGDADLDTEFARDGLADVMAWLRTTCLEAEKLGKAPESVVGESGNPGRAMRNMAAYVRNYRDFCVQAQQGGASAGADWLEQLRVSFLDNVPDFESFPSATGWPASEREYKDKTADEVRSVLQTEVDEDRCGDRICRLLYRSSDGPLVQWDVHQAVTKAGTPDALRKEFHGAIVELARSSRPAGEALERAHSRLLALQRAGVKALTPGARLSYIMTLWGLLHPDDAAPFKIGKFKEVFQRLGEPWPFAADTLTAADFDTFKAVLSRIFETLAERWHWQPKDLIDVQTFLWIALTDLDEDEENEAGAGTDETQADRIRQFVLNHHINPARHRGDRQVSVEVSGLLSALELPPSHGNAIYTALQARKFLELAQVPAPELVGPEQGVNRRLVFALGDAVDEDDPPLPDGPYWFLGAMFGRTEDQLPRFLAEGIWEVSEPSDRQRQQVLSMAPGQRIAIKATYIRTNGVKFDNRGLAVSCMAIKATGTITANPGNGSQVSVAWDPEFPQREWYHYTYQPTIWEVYPNKDMARRLIRFAFHGEEQDYDWFLGHMKRWQEPRVVEEAVPASPVPRNPTNVVLYGPPGTGKTYSTMAAAVALCNGLPVSRETLDAATDRKTLRKQYDELRQIGQIGFVTFHQTYGYEEFIEGLRPKALPGGGFTLTPEPGAFLDMVKRAMESDEEHVLIIDELNRGNISKIFGELITLIEPDKRSGMPEQISLRLPHSGAEFSVPANLHIVGTMNTADRSIALLDTALRRRFRFIEVAPQPDLLKPVGNIDLKAVLTKINERIEYLIDREHRIGHAFFIDCDDRTKVDAAMRDKVIPLLQEYFFEDWGRIHAVIGSGFIEKTMIDCPLEGGGDPKESWTLKKRYDEDAYDQLLGRKRPAPADVATGADQP